MDQQQNTVKPESVFIPESPFLPLLPDRDYSQILPVIECKYIDLPQVPVMHPDRFAELIGLSAGVVGGWIDLGYVPTVKIGKYRLINLAALFNTSLALQS